MLTIAHIPAAQSTHTDDDLHESDDRLYFGSDSQMELAVSWSGRQRSFEIAEFSMEEIVVVGFRVDDIDLCHHEACLDYCDGELLDEVTCRVVFRGFEGPGVARLRLVAQGLEQKDLARFTATLRARIERSQALHRVCVAAACGWL